MAESSVFGHIPLLLVVLKHSANLDAFSARSVQQGWLYGRPILLYANEFPPFLAEANA